MEAPMIHCLTHKKQHISTIMKCFFSTILLLQLPPSQISSRSAERQVDLHQKGLEFLGKYESKENIKCHSC